MSKRYLYNPQNTNLPSMLPLYYNGKMKYHRFATKCGYTMDDLKYVKYTK